MNNKPNSSSLIFIIILAIASLAQINADMYIPSFSAIASELNASINHMQLTLSLYLFTMSLSQLVYGPLSEIIGRKSSLIIGIIINAAGAFICWRAQNVTLLIIGRTIQGIGTGAAACLFRAVLRDCYTKQALSKIVTYFINAMIIVVVVAPLLGSYFQHYLGWRATFIFLFAYSIMLTIVIMFLFKETHSKLTQKPSLLSVINSYNQLLTNRLFVGCSLCSMMAFGGLFSWLSSASPILIDFIGVNTVTFGYIIFSSAIAAFASNYINTKLIQKRKPEFVVKIGLYIIILSSISMFVLSKLFPINTYIVIIPAFLFIFGTGFIWGNTFSLAFQPFGHIAGYAGAIYGCLQVSGGAVFSGILSKITEKNQVPLSIMLILSSMLAWFSFQFIAKSVKK